MSKNRRERWNSTANALHETVDFLTQARTALKKELADLKEATEARIKKLHEQHEAERKEANEALVEARDQLAKAWAACSTYQEEIRSMTKEQVDVKAQLEDQRAAVRGLTERLERLGASEIEAAREDIATMSEICRGVTREASGGAAHEEHAPAELPTILRPQDVVVMVDGTIDDPDADPVELDPMAKQDNEGGDR